MLTFLSLWIVASAILPTVMAFYPYHLKEGSGGSEQIRRATFHHTQASNLDVPRRPLTLPLRRMPVQPRQNQYKILSSVDPKQKNSVAVDQDGKDLSYMVAVTFGSSKEEYHLLLDSGASNTWVMGETCKTDACTRHNTFGKGDSDTLKVRLLNGFFGICILIARQTDSTPFSVTYGTGSVSGTTASDTIHIGSLSTTLTFGVANNVSQEFSSYPMDGIMGIGRGDNVEGTIEAPQLIEELANAGLVSSKIYGVHLGRAADGANDGELNIGEINKNRFDGDLNWISANNNDIGFWEVAIADAGADNTMTGMKGRSAILDTGTSFILMPEDDALALHKLIDGYTQSGETFTVPCSTTKAMQVKLGSITYDIPSKDWVGGTAESGLCNSNIIGRKTFGDNQWLMGDVFCKNMYTVFDLDNSRVGFGLKDANTPSSSSSSASPSSSSASSSSAAASPGQSSPSPTSSSPPSSVPSSPTSVTDTPVSADASSTASAAPVSGSANQNSPAESSPLPQKGEGAGGRISALSMLTLTFCITLGALSTLT